MPGWPTAPRSTCASAPSAREIRAAGYAILCWTVNDRRQARKLFGRGASCIVTDRLEVRASVVASQDDLHRVGTISHILKMFKLPDGSLRLIVQGLARVTLDDVTASKPYLVARVSRASEALQEGDRVEQGVRRVRRGRCSGNTPERVRQPGRPTSRSAAWRPVGTVWSSARSW